MSTSTLWIVVAGVVAVLLVVALAVLAMRAGNRRRQRQAEEIREQARLETAKLERREALAQETAAKARAAQAEAEVKAAEAARLQERAAKHQSEAATSRERLREQHVLLDALGVDLPDELLELALTHRSYAYEHGGLPTNERLEFLGDAVLGLTITDELYHRHPDRSEGELAKLRASVVNTQALADVARNLTPGGLGVHIRLGRGEETSGGAGKSSILADGMESLLGAIYLHQGMEVAREVILRLFGPLLDAAATLGAGLDWKTSLQELTAARGLGPPSYVVTSTGPDHDKEFTAVVVVMDTEYGSGVGRTKKEAEQKAASTAWKALDVLDSAGKTSA